MTATETLALIAAIASGVTAILTAAGVVMGLFMKRNIQELHVSTNSGLAQLIETTKRLATANGMALGRAEERDANKAVVAATTLTDIKERLERIEAPHPKP